MNRGVVQEQVHILLFLTDMTEQKFLTSATKCLLVCEPLFTVAISKPARPTKAVMVTDGVFPVVGVAAAAGCPFLATTLVCFVVVL